jgi:hypothetical protein
VACPYGVLVPDAPQRLKPMTQSKALDDLYSGPVIAP